MKNVELTVEGTMLTIKVDLSKDFGPSSSGKTTIIASSFFSSPSCPPARPARSAKPEPA
jgi:hypothetical protein